MRYHVAAGLTGHFLNEDMIQAIVLDDERVSIEHFLVIMEKYEGNGREPVAG